MTDDEHKVDLRPFGAVVQTWAVYELCKMVEEFALAETQEEAEAAKDRLLYAYKFVAILEAAKVYQEHGPSTKMRQELQTLPERVEKVDG